jgi:hypothetical protein
MATFAFAGLAAFVYTHPMGRVLPLAGIAACLFVLLLHRDAWMQVLFALLPVVDLAPRTGMVFWTESDALLLCILGVFGAREALAGGRNPRSHGPGAWGLRTGQVALLFLLAASYAVSTAWTPIAAIGSDPNLPVGYDSPLNGVRLAKGFLFALALVPLFATSFGRDGQGAGRRLALGLVFGLLAASLAAFWERLSFTGLSDFSSDYRTTALFWEMHVGGAQLDGWLALTFPFALWHALRERSPARHVVWMAVLALAVYAIFTTFSRGLYLATAVSTPVLLLALWRQDSGTSAARAAGGQARPAWRYALLAVLAGLFAWAIAEVFRTGGYRGMAASLGLALGGYLAAPAAARATRRGAMGALAIAGLVVPAGYLAFGSFAKGPYLAYGCCAGLVAVLCAPTVRANSASGGQRWDVAVLASVAALGAASVWVAVHWGGAVALVPALAVAAMVASSVSVAAAFPPLRWEVSLRGGFLLALAGGAVALVAVTFNTYYAASRLESAGDDFRGRLVHWSRGASLVGPDQTLLGIGTGRYAPAYFWASDGTNLPGNHRIGIEPGNAYLALGGPRHVLGFGELYRVLQQVANDTALPVTVTLRARSPDLQGQLHVEVCRRHLIYVQGCATRQVDVPAGRVWKSLTIVLDVGDFGPLPGMPPRPVFFAIANSATGRVLDVDDVSVTDAGGRSLVSNGGFADGTSRWFFSSDKHHLPWHAKNLWLHFWIEQGVFGVMAFSFLAVGALFRTSVGAAAAHPLAPPLLAGLAGFFVVGLFDSLVDAPRMALAFFALAIVALGVRGTPAARPPQVPQAL